MLDQPAKQSGSDGGTAARAEFRLEEATIDELHAAIRAGKATCVSIVEHYLARVRCFNGVASMLVTANGAPVVAATGAIRGGAPLKFPTATVKADDDFAGPRQI